MLKAWRIYHNDAFAKTELTSSPARVKKAIEDGLTVVELVEKQSQNSIAQSDVEKLRELGVI